MQRNVKVVFWVSLLCAGCFFVTWNVRSIFTDRPSVLLGISPEEIEFQTPFVEGTEFQAEFTLKNKTRSDLLIKKVMSSCGCTGLFTKKGESLEVPMVLTPFQSLPILVTVDTKGRDGKGGVSVMVLYEHRGKSLFSTATILFDVVQQDALLTGEFGMTDTD